MISAQYVDGLELRIKELSEQLETMTKECESLRADAERYVSWIDGVIEIVELYSPDTPSQTGWKQRMVARGYELIQRHIDAAMEKEE